MAMLMRCLLLVFSCALVDAELPPNFPCLLPPVVLDSKLSPPEGGIAWPAQCLGLTDDGTGESTNEKCAAACNAQEKCNVWQLTEEKVCYLADDYTSATNCWGRDTGGPINVLGGQRLQRGTVKVNNDIANGNWFPNLKFVGSFEAANVAQGQDRCKGQCYSNPHCDKWVYVSPASGEGGQAEGCYLQDGTVTPGGQTTMEPAQVTKGEVITHECSKPAPKEEIPSNLEHVLIWTALVCLCLVCGLLGAILVARLTKKEEKKGPKTRAVKVAPKQKQEAQPLVRMPAVMVQQPMVAYAAPQVVTQAPVATTYQVVPQTTTPVASIAAVPQVVREGAPLI